MLYYLLVPAYLTALFFACYWGVRGILRLFDKVNFFWDWWDDKKQHWPSMGYIEFVVLGLIVWYIVRYELQGST